MKKTLYTLLILTCVSTVVRAQSCYKLVQSDEFNYTGLPDASKWSAENWNPGAVNNELQSYVGNRLENSRVENGHLIIEAHRDWHNGHEYSSARLHSNYKMTFKYGRIEFRAILPGGKGTWPALWLMPSDIYHYATTCSAQTGWINGCDAWPNSGELDVMEYVGYQPGVIHGSAHTKNANFMLGNNFTKQLSVTNETTEFHTYALEWSENKIEWFVDDASLGVLTKTSNNWQDWPFDIEFYPILNIAVGGSWGGAQGVDNSIFPVRMVVDYVRFYEKETNGPQTSFNNQTNSIPGILEMEDYDEGCNGSAYYDLDGNNQGGDYRTDGVDIAITTSGTTHVGWTEVDEWLEYTLTITQAANYKLAIRSASETAGGEIDIYLDNNLLLGSIQLPVTGSWDSWEMTETIPLSLPAGEHVLQVKIKQSGVNLDYIAFKEIVTGVSEVTTNESKVYPNPANTLIQIDAPQNSSYTLLDVTGQQVLSGVTTTNTTILNMGSLSKGIYYLKMESTYKNETHKIILQ